MNSSLPNTTFLEIPAIGKIRGTLRLPGSKSITNRALLLAALAKGTTRLLRPLLSDDTRYMAESLERLGVPGIRFSEDRSEAAIAGGNGNFASENAELFVGNSGTSIRFLTAAAALGHGEYSLTGISRMKERPIRDLVSALAQIGVRIDYLEKPGFPPIALHADGLRGGTLHIRGDISSQYLTAILLSAPCMENPLTIIVDGELISRPYVSMTLRMMEQFGAFVENRDFKEFAVQNSGYESPGDYTIEGDASSATYALAAAAIAGGPVRLYGIDKNSIQGDIRFADFLEKLGAKISFGEDFVECARGEFPLKAFDEDLSAIPDAAMTAAVLGLFADGKCTLRGIGSWKVKETDRIFAMTTELRKTGANVIATNDTLEITPPKKILPATFETYRDHRMAMCLSLAAFGVKDSPIRIIDPLCVEKTYPDYWKDFEKLTGVPLEIQGEK